MHCLMSQKLTCFEKTDSFDAGGSEASTPARAYPGYVPVTPVSAMSYDLAAEDCPNPRFLPDAHEDGANGENVFLHLYDLNDTFGHMNSVSLDLLGIGGALHVGIEVLGNEWSFGMQGVSVTTPKMNQYYTFRQTVPMGRTRLKRKEVESAILSMKRAWSGKDYDLLTRNCGHFCNELCEKLGLGRMPAWVTRVAETMAAVPGSQTLKDSITRAIMEDGADVPQEDGAEGYLASTPPYPSGAFPSSNSPVSCRYGNGDPGFGMGELPRARCEAFRVHEGRSRKANGGARATQGPDGSILTDKYGSQGQHMQQLNRQLVFAGARGGC